MRPLESTPKLRAPFALQDSFFTGTTVQGSECTDCWVLYLLHFLSTDRTIDKPKGVMGVEGEDKSP